MNASKRGKLDHHIANDHLNIDLKEVTLLIHCRIHYKDRISRPCLTNTSFGTPKDMIHRRCQIIKHIMVNAQIKLSKEH